MNEQDREAYCLAYVFDNSGKGTANEYESILDDRKWSIVKQICRKYNYPFLQAIEIMVKEWQHKRLD